MPTASAIRALIVDDQLTSRALIRDGLQQLGIQDIGMASDGEQGLKSLMQKPVHLIISDLNMPGGDGLQVLPRLCASLAGKSTPVMVLSGDTTPDTKSTLLRAGIAAVLAKPVEPKRLIEEVLRLFPQKSTGRF